MLGIMVISLLMHLMITLMMAVCGWGNGATVSWMLIGQVCMGCGHVAVWS